MVNGNITCAAYETVIGVHFPVRGGVMKSSNLLFRRIHAIRGLVPVLGLNLPTTVLLPFQDTGHETVFHIGLNVGGNNCR